MPNGTDFAMPTRTPCVVTPIAREDRSVYDAGAAEAIDDPIAVLTAGDRDDVLRNLQDAESALREVFPELVLVLNAAAGGELLIGEVAQAMGRLSSATRTVEERVAAGPPDPASHPGQGGPTG